MTSVVRPPRRPSSLAIRSRWPVQVPTSDTESAPSTGVAMRMARVVEYKRAFIIEPPCVAHNQYSFLTRKGQGKGRGVGVGGGEGDGGGRVGLALALTPGFGCSREHGVRLYTRRELYASHEG